MADLIVIAFENEKDAEGAYEKVQELQGDLIVQLAGLALVKVDEQGKTHVQYPGGAGRVGIGAAGGALFGVLIGILFFVPFFGLVFGGLIGALFAGIDKTGLNSEFRSQVKESVTAGKAAVVLYTNKLTEDKFAAAIAPFNGKVIKTSLSDEDEKALIHDLAEQPQA
jgi:uncharacterized membrane protein